MSNPVSLWSSGYTADVEFFTFYENYMFFANRGSGYVKRINLDGTNSINWAQVNTAICCTVYNNSLYVNDYNSGNIYRIVINPDGTAGAKTTFATVGIYCIGSVVANVNGIDYLFVTNNHGIISKLSLTSDKSNDNLSWFNCGSDSYGMVVYNGFLYIANNGGNRIIQVNLSNPSIYNYTWAGSTQGVLYPVGLVLFNGYIYVSNNAGNQYVNKISLTNPGTNYVSNFITGVSQPSGIAMDSNNYLYILSSSGGTIYKMNNALLDNLYWSVSSSYNGNLSSLTFYGNYAYFANTANNKIARLNLNGTINNLNWAPTGLYPQCSAVYNGYLYVTNSGGSTLTQILISDSTVINQNWISVPANCGGIFVDGNTLYVASYQNGTISKIPINNDNTPGTLTTFVSGLNRPLQILLYDGYIYVANSGNNRICRILLSDVSQINYNWASGVTLSYPSGLAVQNGYLYVSNTNNNTITQILISDQTKYLNWKTNSNGLNGPSGIILNGDYLYVFMLNSSPQNIAQYYLPGPPPVIPPTPPCFKKDTKILTDKGYIPVQYLRKGDLVKTLRNEYKAIEMIGKKLITHDASQERNKKQLFVYRHDQYPEIMEDLVLTGCHSILVDRFSSEQQREKTLKTNGDIYVTDKRYRLPAVADEKAMIFEASGDYMIYHFALENEDYYMNYGIYANGLLVETCSKRYLKECSDMMLIGV